MKIVYPAIIELLSQPDQKIMPQLVVNVDLATQHIELKTSLSLEQARDLIEDAGFPVLS